MTISPSVALAHDRSRYSSASVACPITEVDSSVCFCQLTYTCNMPNKLSYMPQRLQPCNTFNAHPQIHKDSERTRNDVMTPLLIMKQHRRTEHVEQFAPAILQPYSSPPSLATTPRLSFSRAPSCAVGYAPCAAANDDTRMSPFIHQN